MMVPIGTRKKSGKHKKPEDFEASFSQLIDALYIKTQEENEVILREALSLSSTIFDADKAIRRFRQKFPSIQFDREFHSLYNKILVKICRNRTSFSQLRELLSLVGDDSLAFEKILAKVIPLSDSLKQAIEILDMTAPDSKTEVRALERVFALLPDSPNHLRDYDLEALRDVFKSHTKIGARENFWY